MPPKPTEGYNIRPRFQNKLDHWTVHKGANLIARIWCDYTSTVTKVELIESISSLSQYLLKKQMNTVLNIICKEYSKR